MLIRNTRLSDLDEVMKIYAMARDFMREGGNPDQWGISYPPRELIESDIADRCGYVIENEGEIVGTFFFKTGPDPTYLKIYGGKWLNDDEYGVIHRIAVKYKGRNIISEAFNYCSRLIGSIRIDTHRQNVPMQKALEKHGFCYCGVIYLESGDERIAYQRTR